MISDSSIAKKLLDETFNLTNDLNTINDSDINNYFTDVSKNYNKLKDETDEINKNYNKEAYIYDIIIINKLYAIIYRLFWHHFNITLDYDKKKFKDFINNLEIKFNSDEIYNIKSNIEIVNTNQDKKNIYRINLNNLFNIDNLKLEIDNSENDIVSHNNINNIDYDTIYNQIYDIYNKNILDIYNKNNDKYIPLYHKYVSNIENSKIDILSEFKKYDYNNIIKVNIIDIDSQNPDKFILDDATNKIKNIYIKNTTFTLDTLNKYYKKIINSLQDNDYQKQRIFLYLDALNTILTFDDNIDTFLSKIKYNMYQYNILLYNALIQYTLLYNNLILFINHIKKIIENIKLTNLNKYTTLLNNNIDIILKINNGGYSFTDLKDMCINIKNTINIINDNIIIINNVFNVTNENKTLIIDYNTFKSDIISILNNIEIIKTLNFEFGTYLYRNKSKNQLYSYQNEQIIKLNFFDFDYTISSIQKNSQYIQYSISDIIYYFSLNNIVLNLNKNKSFTDKIKSIAKSYGSIIDFINKYSNKNELITTQYENFKYDLKNIEIFTNNLNNLILNYKNIQKIEINRDIKDDIINNVKDIKDVINAKDINNSLITFSDISSKYKNEWKIYNKGVFYYRILLLISIILFIAIIIINNIIINTKNLISIFVIFIILILFLILFIYKKPNKEHFTSQISELDILAANVEFKQIVIAPTSEEKSDNDNYIEYKSKFDEYKKLINKFSYEESNKFNLLNEFRNTLKSNNINNYISEYNKKLEYYKTKSVDLFNGIEILKKTNMQNYYIILIIYIAFIFILLGFIGLILYPTKFYTIIISIGILFLITLILIIIKIHKINNMSSNKNYWSNLNPSVSLKELNSN
jgi:hypothetical protein